MVKRGRSLKRKKCSKSPSGKHEPKYNIRQGVTSDERVQVCKYCGKRLSRWKMW